MPYLYLCPTCKQPHANCACTKAARKLDDPWHRVPKDEFDAFVASRELEARVTNICEPSLRGYYDTRGEMIAREWLYEYYPEDGALPYRKAPNQYEVLAVAAP